MFKLGFIFWLEIPYFIGINYNKNHSINYKGREVQLKIKFHNDLFFVTTHNKLVHDDYSSEQHEQLKYLKQNFSNYVTKEKLPIIKDFIKSHNLPYLNIERTETVVELYFEIDDITQSLYEEITREFYGCPEALFPEVKFFIVQIFPKISDVINTYRVATLPVLRYKIQPVSENLIENAFIEIHDLSTNKIVQKWTHGFDGRNYGKSMQYHEINLGVQSRFDSLIDNPEYIEFELQFCSAYYLFHMRRWAESVTIASGVVDSLVKELVFTKLSEPMAKILWDKYKTQTIDLFNKVLPALEYKKLETENQELWCRFKKAKEFRGSAAHGKTINLFKIEQQKEISGYLNTLYEVASWLSKQNNRTWMLDINGYSDCF
jgi:hypothetical protein